MSSNDGSIRVITQIIFIFLLLGSVLIHVGVIEIKDNSYNTTQHIIDKDSVYVYEVMNNGYQYFIFTEQFCFEVDIETYNKLSVNDSIVVNVDNFNLGSFTYDGHYFVCK